MSRGLKPGFWRVGNARTEVRAYLKDECPEVRAHLKDNDTLPFVSPIPNAIALGVDRRRLDSCACRDRDRFLFTQHLYGKGIVYPAFQYKRKSQFFGKSTERGGRGFHPRGVKSNADLYVGMLSSRTIAARLVERFHLMSAYETKKESAAIKRLGTQSRFEAGVRDHATVPDTKSGPPRLIIVAVGLLFGIILGILWVLLAHRDWMPRSL